MDREHHFIDTQDATSEYAEKLLNREPDSSYVSMWEDLLRRIKNAPPEHPEGSVILFRLGMEWLGLSTKLVEQVLDVRSVHTVPSCRSKIFLGVINVGGQLRLCVALHKLLDIPSTADHKLPEVHVKGLARRYRRMVAIRRGVEVWVFPVDEIYGVVNCNFNALDNIPVTVSKSTANYLHGLLSWKEQGVGVIDGELLFESLRRLVP